MTPCGAMMIRKIYVDAIEPNGVAGNTCGSSARLRRPQLPIDIQPADATATMHWIFPDRGICLASLPHDVAWKSDIHR